MSEKTMKNIPKLRFSEFMNSGEWQEKKLGDLGDLVASGDLNSELFSEIQTNQHIYPVYSNSISNNGLYGYYLSPKYPKNSVTITARGNLGIAFNRESEFVGIGRLLILSNLKSHISNFIKELWNHSALIPLENGGIPQLTAIKAKQTILLIPEQKEQQKISDCLNSIDTLIFVQNQKIKLLEKHKKGLLQNFFPKDGEDIPKIRFPEFLNDEKWEKTTIGKIGSFYYGKSAPKWSLEEDALTPCVRYGELYTKFGTVITETYSRTNIDPKNLKFSRGGEILIPRVGEKPEDFGKCCCYLPLGNIAIGEMISVFETSQNPLFYTYYFRNLYKNFANVVEGQNVKNLYYVELEPLEIYRPSLEEQQKIADCLTSIDEQINLQIQKVESLKEHKKALLQQLFPSNEVNE